LLRASLTASRTNALTNGRASSAAQRMRPQGRALRAARCVRSSWRCSNAPIDAHPAMALAAALQAETAPMTSTRARSRRSLAPLRLGVIRFHPVPFPNRDSGRTREPGRLAFPGQGVGTLIAPAGEAVPADRTPTRWICPSGVGRLHPRFSWGAATPLAGTISKSVWATETQTTVGERPTYSCSRRQGQAARRALHATVYPVVWHRQP